VKPATFQVQVVNEQVGELADPQTGLGQCEVERERPGVGGPEEGKLRIGSEDEDGLGIVDLEPVERQLGEEIASAVYSPFP
jgi:hypothetical protein